MQNEFKDKLGAETPGKIIAAREMTVEEVIDSRIAQHNRDIAALMQMKDSLHCTIRGQGISSFERLFGALFNRQF